MQWFAIRHVVVASRRCGLRDTLICHSIRTQRLLSTTPRTTKFQLSVYQYYELKAHRHLSTRTYSTTSPNKTSNESKDLDNNETRAQNTIEHKQAPIPSLDNYSPFYRQLARLLPNIKRPTEDDFLKVADGFWARLRIRWKWFTIRSFRRFRADEVSAFVTWFLMSQTVWILAGTTGFFSVLFAITNSLRLQEYVARMLSDYLTSETGVQITFESAIVPKWKDSRISFKNVSISRSVDAEHKSNESIISIHVDSIDVTLSLMRWLDGKGIVNDAIVHGVRGFLDRRSIVYDPTLQPSDFRRPESPGSFNLEYLVLTDVLVTVYEAAHRPYTFSILSGKINTLRKQWLFYDFLSESEGMVGMFDGCLFSLHRPQMVETNRQGNPGSGKMSRFRIDGVNVSHIQAISSPNDSSTSPISWIKSGKVDAVLDFHFPKDLNEDIDLNSILSELASNISAMTDVKGDKSGRVLGQKELARPALTSPNDNRDGETEARATIRVDIDLRFRDIKAAVPYFQSELSYTNSALIRPIVAFMNANRTLIPIHCYLTLDLEDFNGSWTLWETGLTDSISLKVYEALAYHVSQANMNHRLKTVSLWSLQVTASSIVGMLRTILDPISVHLRELYLNDGTFW